MYVLLQNKILLYCSNLQVSKTIKQVTLHKISQGKMSTFLSCQKLEQATKQFKLISSFMLTEKSVSAHAR